MLRRFFRPKLSIITLKTVRVTKKCGDKLANDAMMSVTPNPSLLRSPAGSETPGDDGGHVESENGTERLPYALRRASRSDKPAMCSSRRRSKISTLASTRCRR